MRLQVCRTSPNRILYLNILVVKCTDVNYSVMSTFLVKQCLGQKLNITLTDDQIKMTNLDFQKKARQW